MRAWIGAPNQPSIEPQSIEEASMFYGLFGYLHAAAVGRLRAIRALAEDHRGQGTVEYVGLILLVSLLMVGMVAAMKGFNGKQGTELADVIVDKIKEAVDKVAFK
jgi:Flp pilus assembly pilin Flp